MFTNFNRKNKTLSSYTYIHRLSAVRRFLHNKNPVVEIRLKIKQLAGDKIIKKVKLTNFISEASGMTGSTTSLEFYPEFFYCLSNVGSLNLSVSS